MSEDSIKVFIIENDQMWQEKAKEILEDTNFNAIVLISNILESMETIPELDQLGVQFILFDTTFMPNDLSDSEGVKIAKKYNAPVIYNGDTIPFKLPNGHTKKIQVWISPLRKSNLNLLLGSNKNS